MVRHVLHVLVRGKTRNTPKRACFSLFALGVGVIVWRCVGGGDVGGGVGGGGPGHEKHTQTGAFFMFFVSWQGGEGTGMLPVR